MFAIILHPLQATIDNLQHADRISLGRKPEGDALVVRMIEGLEMMSRGIVDGQPGMTVDQLLEHCFKHTAMSEDYKFRPMSVGDVALVFKGKREVGEYWLCLSAGWRKIL